MAKKATTRQSDGSQSFADWQRGLYEHWRTNQALYEERVAQSENRFSVRLWTLLKAQFDAETEPERVLREAATLKYMRIHPPAITPLLGLYTGVDSVEILDASDGVTSEKS